VVDPVSEEGGGEFDLSGKPVGKKKGKGHFIVKKEKTVLDEKNLGTRYSKVQGGKTLQGPRSGEELSTPSLAHQQRGGGLSAGLKFFLRKARQLDHHFVSTKFLGVGAAGNHAGKGNI